MGDRIKRFFIGKPLRNDALSGERFGVLWGLPILSSDAISSVAYAGEQILLVLLPVFFAAAYTQMRYVVGAIVGLLAILILSYRQTIDAYPNGGGAYIVAKDNLGPLAGITAGAALAVDYVLTVAVSMASGVEQIATAFPALAPYITPICVGLILLLMLGNLRGIRESSRIFGIPTYLFIISMAIMIAVGLWKLITHTAQINPIPQPTAAAATSLAAMTGPATLVLLLRSFSNGCSALTGVEAVSNAVPIFKEPSRKTAKRVLLLLALCVIITLAGTTVLASAYHVVTGGAEPKAVIVQIAQITFGSGTFLYFCVVASTFIILVLAANTAYAGLPLLLSLISSDGFAPRQLSRRGDRLSFSNGIILLTVAAMLLIVVFNARVDALIGLYAIGVFLSFTLSQFGMFRHWQRERGRHWHLKATINGLGSFVTALVVIIIAVFKFQQGAWIVVVLVPALVFMMLRTKRHYIAVAKQLRLEDMDEAHRALMENPYRTRVIVPLASVNRASVRALRYARTIAEDVTAFSVAVDEQGADHLQQRWNLMQTDVPFVIRLSPTRRVTQTLLAYIESAEYERRPGDIVTIILPQFMVHRWWHNLLHNHTRATVQRHLLRHKHIVVAVMPFQLTDDDTIIGPGHTFTQND